MQVLTIVHVWRLARYRGSRTVPSSRYDKCCAVAVQSSTTSTVKIPETDHETHVEACALLENDQELDIKGNRNQLILDGIQENAAWRTNNHELNSVFRQWIQPRRPITRSENVGVAMHTMCKKKKTSVLTKDSGQTCQTKLDEEVC